MFSQSPTFSWVKQLGGTGSDQLFETTCDKFGNSYCQGYFDGIADFDPGPNTYTLNGGSGSSFFVKLDQLGNFVFAFRILNAFGKALTIDSTGNIILTGEFSGTADFDPGPGVYNLTSVTISSDAYILKIGPFGNFIWASTLCGQGAQTPLCVKVDPSNNIYIVGYYLGDIDLNPGPAVDSYSSTGSWDGFICKLDSSGNYIWGKNMSGSTTELVSKISVNTNEDVYIVGTYYGNIDLDPGPLLNQVNCLGGEDGFIVKLNNLGNFVWGKNLSSSGNEFFNHVVCKNGILYLSSIFQGIVDYDLGPSVFNLTSYGSNDAAVIKLDTSGNFIWAKNIGSSGDDRAENVQVDGVGDVYFCGEYSQTVDFDPGPGFFNLSSTGYLDAYICKLSNTGNFVWAISIGGAGNNERLWNFSIICNGISLAGQFANTVDFDPSPSSNTLSPFGGPGNTDFYVQKLNSFCTTPPPINSSSFSSMVICGGQNATLSVNSAYQPYWFTSASGGNPIGSGSVFYTPTLSVSSTFYIESAIGCCSSVNRTPITVTVNPIPNLNPIGAGTYCYGTQSISLSVSGANSYSWSNNSTSPSITIVPSSSQTFTVIGTFTATGCSSSSLLAVNLVNCTNLEDYSFMDQIQINPNPSSGIYNIKTKSGLVLELELINSLGLVVYHGTTKDQINITEFPSGIYFVRIANFTKKLIKN
ncbi:MAG: T9SS type A sorting domain-containing protein [Sphingobacteriaceae bacterium]